MLLKWRLLSGLHEVYGSELGEHSLGWLRQNAAFTQSVDAEIELAAFAETYAQTPIEITDENLRELRDRLSIRPKSDRIAPLPLSYSR